jgi:hypothetical protein
VTNASTRRREAAAADREARWPGFLAIFAAAILHYALPGRLILGPDWLLIGVIVLLLIAIIISYRRGNHDLTRVLTFVANGALTMGLIGSLALLAWGIPHHKDPPSVLLRSAALLWVTNVLVFALWYWKLDAGGPYGRDSAEGPIKSAFLFPQFLEPGGPAKNWSPNFVDYLFFAFTTSTAFSPTDTAVLSRWAKGCMMLQAIISLTLVAVLAARAINVL